jgi:hypothetical protein
MPLRRHATALMVTTLLLALSVPPASAAIYVDCDNVSGQEDGTREHPFRLISSGMATASFGDTVLVLPGLYQEWIGVDMHDPEGMNRACVVMKDGVALVAYAGPDSTTIKGLTTEAAVFFDSCGPSSTLSGFTIIADGFGWGMRVAIMCWSSSPSILGNVTDWPFASIYSRSGSNPTVSGNSIQGGVAFMTGSGGLVKDNAIDGTVGVYFSPCLPVLIEGNLIYSSSSARYEDAGIDVHYGTSGNVLAVNNTIRDKEVGALLCFGELRGNRFLNNQVNVKLRRYCEVRGDVIAEMNWWGTTVPEEIEAKIIDCADDPELPACVDYEPWCMDEDCTQSPVESMTWGSIKRMYVPRE